MEVSDRVLLDDNDDSVLLDECWGSAGKKNGKNKMNLTSRPQLPTTINKR